MPISRRSMLAASGAAFAAVNSGGIAKAQKKNLRDKELLKVGIVGCGPYSHCVSYGKVMLGMDGKRKFQTTMQATHVWGDDYSKNYAGKLWESGAAQKSLAARSAEYIAKGSDAVQVADYREMIGKIDAAMIMDFDRAAELAEPFLAEGMPVFVNRPYAPTMNDGRKILADAAKTGAAVFTGSLTPWVFEARKTAAAVDRDKLFAFHADGLTASFSRYVPHALEYIYYIVGPGVRRVRLSGWDGSAGLDPSHLPPILIELEYGPRGGADYPLRGTLLMREHCENDWWFRGYHMGGDVVEGVVPAHNDIPAHVGDDHWRIPFLLKMADIFRANESPETPDDILHKLATLLAAHKSAMNGGEWVDIDDVENHSLPTVITGHWTERV